MTLIVSLGLIILCCLIIWRASDGFEAASEYLGRNLTDGVRGVTINAIGSSMPELFTTLWFLFVLHDRDGFAGGALEPQQDPRFLIPW
jgi:Ca2+/Na+ antiporter